MSANNGNDVEKRLWAVADQLWANSGLLILISASYGVDQDLKARK